MCVFGNILYSYALYNATHIHIHMDYIILYTNFCIYTTPYAHIDELAAHGLRFFHQLSSDTRCQAYMYIHTYIHTCMFVYICMYMYVYCCCNQPQQLFPHTLICIYMVTHTNYVCTMPHTHILDMYIYIHKWKYIFTYFYMYTYIHIFVYCCCNQPRRLLPQTQICIYNAIHTNSNIYITCCHTRRYIYICAGMCVRMRERACVYVCVRGGTYPDYIQNFRLYIRVCVYVCERGGTYQDYIKNVRLYLF